ncbi:hypothetical protein, partial [Nodularia spumigena]
GKLEMQAEAGKNGVLLDVPPLQEVIITQVIKIPKSLRVAKFLDIKLISQRSTYYMRLKESFPRVICK